MKRRYYVDFMKFIGICCLFFAHVQGPEYLEEIRGFDVPMLVILSGVLTSTSVKKNNNPQEYIYRRIKRLVIPTWLFLAFFYLCMILIGQSPKISDVIKSFLFQRDCGIAGGVWIIWVYLICAVSAPFIINICKTKDKRKIYIITMSIMLLLFDGVVTYYPILIENRFLYYTLFSIIPYCALISIGLFLERLTSKGRVALGVIALVIYILIGSYLMLDTGSYQSIAQYKYPARVYYLAYGSAVTIILMEIVRKFEEKLPRLKIVEFVSKHSLWIYLWQIMMLTVVNFVIKINNIWWLSWLTLFIGSVSITWIQNKLVDSISLKYKSNIWNYFKG